MAERREGGRRTANGYWLETLGAVLLIGGLLFLLYQIYTAGNLTSIPLNNYTYGGMIAAAGGVVAFGVGADRGYPKHG